MSTALFAHSKQALLARADLSPKGSIDLPIRSLISFINELAPFVTTSSCSGRISVYTHTSDSEKGINWLLVEHRIILLEEVIQSLDKGCKEVMYLHKQRSKTGVEEELLAILKCEGFILHVHCRDLENARELQQLAISCGFRESGIVLGKETVSSSKSVKPSRKVMLAIRTTAFGLEMPIANLGVDTYQLFLSQATLQIIVEQANERLKKNFARVDKLLVALKSHYSWPMARIKSTRSPTNVFNISRWGHAVASSCDQSLKYHNYIVGGYGTDKDLVLGISSQSLSLHSSKSLRELPIISGPHYNDTKTNISKTSQVSNSNLNSVFNTTDTSFGGTHTAAIMWKRIDSSRTERIGLIVVGGRKSPKEAINPFLQVFEIKDQCENSLTRIAIDLIDIEIEGNGPSARWGHTLTSLDTDNADCSCSSYFLYGGRDEHQIFSDGYILELIDINPIDEKHGAPKKHSKWLWRKIYDDCKPDLQDKVCNHHTSPSEAILNIQELPKGRFFHAACLIIGHSIPESVHSDSNAAAVIVHGGLLSLNDNNADSSIIIFYPKEKRFYPLCSKLDRTLALFGHTISDIGAKTLLLTGGVGTHEFIDHDNYYCNDSGSNSSMYIMDYWGNGDGYIETSSIRALTIESDTKNGVDSLIPCRSCRVHHTIAPLSSPLESASIISRQYILLGGGSMTLAFGAHYCSSLLLDVYIGKNKFLEENISSSKVNNAAKGENNNKTLRLSADASSKAQILSIRDNTTKQQSSSLQFHERSTASTAIVVHRHAVKKVKTFLEKNLWLDKKVRITSFHPSNVDVGKFEANIDPTDCMIIPIASKLIDILQEHDPALSSALKRDDCVLYKLIIPPQEDGASLTVIDSLKATIYSDDMYSSNKLRCYDHILISRQVTPLSKQLVTSSLFRASSFLESFAHEWQIDRKEFYRPGIFRSLATQPGNIDQASYTSIQSLLDKIKFETVGDILVIPDDILCIEFVNENIVHSGSIPDFSSATWQALLAGLASCFGSNRVARKARVDNGQKRESRVAMLLPPCGQVTTCSGPASEGWVTVIENSISFSFDITKVMFCSGNVTERMRMGAIKSVRDNVVVDLYCGIGYYTLPFLVHGGARLVHACDINENSIFALRANLLAAGVSNDRFVIHHGDNRLEDTQLTLRDIADRVSLGLLPSSEEGWPLAANVLSKAGGMMHVHENVRESEIEGWIIMLIERMTTLLQEKGKCMLVTCQHVERVKSYAPRVLHIVADLQCTPLI